MCLVLGYGGSVVEVYLPHKNSIGSFERKVNPYCSKRMWYRWGELERRANRLAKRGLRVGRHLVSEVLALYMELRFCCVRSHSILALSERVYEWLDNVLGLCDG